MSIDTHVCSKVFILTPRSVQLILFIDVTRSQSVTWTFSDVTTDAFPSLLCICTGVAQGLGGKERGGECHGGRGTKGGQQPEQIGGEGVALTYLCRVLHATPISGAVETNPLLRLPCLGWYLGMPTLCAFSWGLSAESWGC